MPERDVKLDGVSQNGFAVHRLSATLHFGNGHHPATGGSPWWLYLDCDPLPARYDVSPDSIWLRASTIGGRPVRALTRIVARHDDACATELILAGLGSLRL